MRKLFCLIVCLFVVASAYAQRDTRPANQLLVVSASVDYGVGKLYVTGSNFGAFIPALKLNGVPLQVLAATPTSIVAMLPPGIAPGSYLLTVASGPAVTEFDAFSMTIGAAGAKGDKGDKGDQGITGPKGDTGPQGLKGDAGPIGPKGDTGLAGAAGTSATADPHQPFETTMSVALSGSNDHWIQTIDLYTLVSVQPGTRLVIDGISVDASVPNDEVPDVVFVSNLLNETQNATFYTQLSQSPVPVPAGYLHWRGAQNVRLYSDRYLTIVCRRALTPSSAGQGTGFFQVSLYGHAME